jgi:DNA-binding SARP family transcriptional activator/tetratricopeptide (TPR) repeat protein
MLGALMGPADAGSSPWEFGILGPLEVRSGTQSLELRRIKERSLLAALLLRVNRVVSLDQLAAVLWEDVGAPRPPATLRVHVSRLRQALAALDADPVIVTSGRGYALQVPADCVDAARFEKLAEVGRRQLVGGDPAAAALTLGDALALWRGPVLSDLSLSPALEPELARLEEGRLTVLEDRVEAELGCGRHHAVVGDLERLVTETPLRERLWGQRMVALYRCGRQAEALRAYEDLRVLLREELGIRPTPALRQLEQAILDQDPSLDLHQGPATVSTTATEEAPGSLPRDGPAAHDHPGGRVGLLGELRGPPEEPAPAVVSAEPDTERPEIRFPARLAAHAVAPFSGRQDQVASLMEAWKEASSGARRVVLVSGEAGIGKTRLAAEFARTVHESGAIVLFGRCDEDIGMPFQPFVEALEQVALSGPGAGSFGRHGGELVRLIPDLGRTVPSLEPPTRADPGTERYLLFDAVVGCLQALSSDAPVLLVLDDLHWAEKPTLLLLRHLVRASDPMRLLVVGTYRDTDLDRTHPLSDVLADLRRELGVSRLALLGLDIGGVRDMLARGTDRVEPPSGELGQLLWSETNGNPFFVQEILRSLLESRQVVARRGLRRRDDEISELGIPEGVREVVGRRLSRLSENANAVLSLSSVIGAVIDFDLVVELSGLSEEAVLDVLDEAAAASLLRETSAGTHEFTHAIVRSTLYEELSTARRSRRHRQVAEALERRGMKDAAALAYHFQRAGKTDVRAVDYSVAAGQEALDRLAFDQAVAFFTQAVEAADDVESPPRRRCELLIGLGTAQRLAGIPASRETLLAAARLAQHLGENELLARAALANNRGFASTAGSMDDERVAVLEAALDGAGPDDSMTRARLLSLLAVELTWRDPTLRRLALADEAVAMARRLGDDVCLLDVWTNAHLALSIPARVPGLVEELPELLALTQRVGDAQQLILAYGLASVHCVEMGELDEAERLLEGISQLAADLNNPFFRWVESNHRCCRLTMFGSGDEIEQAAVAAFQVGQESGQPDLYTWFAPQLFAARWSQGRLGEIVDLTRQTTADTPGLQAWRAALAVMYARVGDVAKAVDIVDELAADPASAFPQNLVWLVGHSLLAEAVAAVGTPEQAAREYELLAIFNGRVPCLANVARPAVALSLATLAAKTGEHERAEEHFADALEQHARLGAPVWLAHTQLEWGRYLLGAGHLERAGALLVLARDAAASVGAVDVLAAAGAMLQEVGEAPTR